MVYGMVRYYLSLTERYKGEISKWSERGGLENRLSARARGFESHSLRSKELDPSEENIFYSGNGEIPKRLKGLPWKGSRSLVAARGFKSLFLR